MKNLTYLFTIFLSLQFLSCKKKEAPEPLSEEEESNIVVPCLFDSIISNLDTNNNYFIREYHYTYNDNSNITYSSYWYGYAIASEDTLGFPKNVNNTGCFNFANEYSDSLYIKYTLKMVFRKGQKSGNYINTEIDCSIRDEILYLFVKKNHEPSTKKCNNFYYRFGFDTNRIPYHDVFNEVEFNGTYYKGTGIESSDRPPVERNNEFVRFKIKAP